MRPDDPESAESIAEILEAAGRMWATAQRATEALLRLDHVEEWPEVVLEDILDAEYLGEE